MRFYNYAEYGAWSFTQGIRLNIWDQEIRRNVRERILLKIGSYTNCNRPVILINQDFDLIKLKLVLFLRKAENNPDTRFAFV